MAFCKGLTGPVFKKVCQTIKKTVNIFRTPILDKKKKTIHFHF